MAEDKSGNTYLFTEQLDHFTTHEDFHFRVEGGDEIIEGVLTVIFDDPDNNMVYFGSGEGSCVFDPAVGACMVNVTNPETGYVYNYISHLNVGASYITTPEVVMYLGYEIETNNLVRTNVYNDGSESVTRFDFIAEMNKYFDGASADGTDDEVAYF